MDNLHSYPSIYNIGHRSVRDLLTVPVNVEEKVDGSQFSFGISLDGEVLVRSKGAKLIVDAPEKMFTLAVESVLERKGLLQPGWTYRGEYLRSPKHNTLCYSRHPAGHIIVFDVNDGDESYLPYEAKADEAERIGLEVVPLVYSGIVSDATMFRSFLERESVLGGQKIEGVVVKPRDYQMFGQDKKALLAKFVSEAFKEVHAGEWRKENPVAGDIIDRLAERYKTPARWQKAVMHLAERGEISDSPKDIGKLIAESGADVELECSEEIRDHLFKWAWPILRRRITAGLPEWYKDELLKKQFAEVPVNG